VAAALDPDEILDGLSGLGEIAARPMFGGYYCRDTIFAIAHRDRLYLKVDERSKAVREIIEVGAQIRCGSR
jgi:TfoX/Sxy family transcriptional regulator of competence genes